MVKSYDNQTMTVARFPFDMSKNFSYSQNFRIFCFSMNQQQELNAILARPENKTCADCGRKNPDWASVPFGICVCLQ